MTENKVLESSLAAVFVALDKSDAFQRANAEAKNPLVQALTHASPVAGLAVGVLEGLTASNVVSNPMFRGGAAKARKIDEKSWPKDADGLLALGRDYLRLGESFWALSAFEKAAVADPAIGDINLYLGQAYLLLYMCRTVWWSW